MLDSLLAQLQQVAAEAGSVEGADGALIPQISEWETLYRNEAAVMGQADTMLYPKDYVRARLTGETAMYNEWNAVWDRVVPKRNLHDGSGFFRPERVDRLHLARFVDHQDVKLNRPGSQELCDRQRTHHEDWFDRLDRLASLLDEPANREVAPSLFKLAPQRSGLPNAACHGHP